uniref:Uncharacterized protein n=1 Tax=Ditylenchus dipsaci TaxID=166011 RepID=A0A915D397_9BILA
MLFATSFKHFRKSIAQSIYCQANEGDSSSAAPSPVQILMEYKDALPEDAFAKLIDIYSNESITLIDRERAAVNYFSNTLPKDVKARMPVPFGFRKLPEELQSRVKSIYYQNGMSLRRN